ACEGPSVRGRGRTSSSDSVGRAGWPRYGRGPRGLRSGGVHAPVPPPTDRKEAPVARAHHRIALIPGDGIGQEVVPPAVAVLDAVGRRHGISFTYDEFDWSCQRYLHEGAMMPPDGLDRIRHHDAIFLGAVGWPGV